MKADSFKVKSGICIPFLCNIDIRLLEIKYHCFCGCIMFISSFSDVALHLF